MKNNENYKKIAVIVNEKMRCLNDFEICDIYDRNMKSKLKSVIAENPDKDPREVLDYFCRPMIQAKLNSWN